MEKPKKSPRQSSDMFDLLEQWQQSGQTQKAFCEQHELPIAVFGYWLRRWRSQQEGWGFSQLHPMLTASSTVFARLRFQDGRELVFEQPVSVQYLKQLL